MLPLTCIGEPCRRVEVLSGCSSAWQSTGFGSRVSLVQIQLPRPVCCRGSGDRWRLITAVRRGQHSHLQPKDPEVVQFDSGPAHWGG